MKAMQEFAKTLVMTSASFFACAQLGISNKLQMPIAMVTSASISYLDSDDAQPDFMVDLARAIGIAVPALIAKSLADNTNLPLSSILLIASIGIDLIIDIGNECLSVINFIRPG